MSSDSTLFETATLAGGCFWCTEAIFKRLKGVIRVTPGYTGGKFENPTYNQVASQTTGHAEAIQIIFDPKVISYEKLLEVFWHLHDPTTKNRQGADVGIAYRSAIFYHNVNQKQIAEASKKRLEKSNFYQSPVITEIVPFTKFYEAEESHQNFYEKNSYSPYCQIVIDPKIRKLLTEFKSDIKEEFKQR